MLYTTIGTSSAALIFALSSATVLPIYPALAANNDDDDDDTATAHHSTSIETTILKGKVLLGPDVTLEESSSPSAAALYITCRPDKSDNVPAAILNGSRGKPPPVLSARIPNPSFPLDFELVIPRDLTSEGVWDGISPLETVAQKAPTSMEQLWWNQMDLIVSARWDSDGVASTRSPEDLVGRGMWKYQGEAVAQVELTGRGAFGKFATGKKK